MSTIDAEIAAQIIAGDGYYKDDDRVTKVVEYDNQWGGRSTAILYAHHNQMKYEESPACSNVRTIWVAK
jgi:hypothetical protein